ncbi:MAG: VWA domain-containing protein, partial [Planctomycetes bacterium]|nr:VWA domain-containing protein [Planctomycetota bacterium]
MIQWWGPEAGWPHVIVAVAIITLIVVARRLAISPRLRSWLILIPRLTVLCLLLWILLNPAKKSEQQLPAQPPQVDFLVDASRSMAFDQPNSRANHVQAVIQGIDSRLSKADRPRVQLYRFGERLVSAADLESLRPTDDASRLAAALEQLPQRFGRTPPKGIVVFSDGAVEDAERLSEIAEGYRRLQVPVHVYPVGAAQLRGDVAIEELVVPPRAEAGAKVPVRGAIRGNGYAGERVVLQVKSTVQPNLPPLARIPITLTDGAQPFEFVVEANPDYGELVLEAPAQPGEVTTQNNRVPFQLTAGRRKLKVIYMEGTPA